MAASKGVIGQLTMAFSNEWAAKGVQVNAIAPGYIATEIPKPFGKMSDEVMQYWQEYLPVDGESLKILKVLLSSWLQTPVIIWVAQYSL